MAKKVSWQWKKFHPAYLSAIKMIPSWVLYTSIAATCLFAVFAAALIRSQADVLNILGDSEITMDFIMVIFRSNIWCRAWIGLMLLSALIAFACCLTPFIMGLFATIPVRSKHQKKDSQNTDVDEDTPTKLQPAKVALTMDERISALRPLIVGYFWDPSFWGTGTNYSMTFKIDLDSLINKKGNIMALGHLAYLLKENRWVAQDFSFKTWLCLFFKALGLEEPSVTNPAKYSDNNDSMATNYNEVDTTFHYLRDRVKYPEPKNWKVK